MTIFILDIYFIHFIHIYKKHLSIYLYTINNRIFHISHFIYIYNTQFHISYIYNV